VACLIEALIKRGATLQHSATVQNLTVAQGRVVGVEVQSPDGLNKIQARCGVVLATGGFSNDATLKQHLYPAAAVRPEAALLASPLTQGTGVHLAGKLGASVNAALRNAAAWSPASLVPQPDGTQIAFPHYIDRNKPGFIAVDVNGKRFTNESQVYVDFVAALLEHCATHSTTQAWLIADAKAVDRIWDGCGAAFSSAPEKVCP
jgi:choline dehydrogenase-like flavoprotein